LATWAALDWTAAYFLTFLTRADCSSVTCLHARKSAKCAVRRVGPSCCTEPTLGLDRLFAYDLPPQHALLRVVSSLQLFLQPDYRPEARPHNARLRCSRAPALPPTRYGTATCNERSGAVCKVFTPWCVAVLLLLLTDVPLARCIGDRSLYWQVSSAREPRRLELRGGLRRRSHCCAPHRC
jgi:hypothetical protein